MEVIPTMAKKIVEPIKLDNWTTVFETLSNPGTAETMAEVIEE